MPSKPVSKKNVTKKKTVTAPRVSASVRKKTTASKATKKTAKIVMTPVTELPPRRSYHLGMQLAIAASAVVVLVLLSAIERNTFATKPGDAAAPPVTIGLEHEAPLSLTILFAKKETSGYVSLANLSGESIHISVPSRWKRSEVTGTDISNVVQEVPVFGFTRYSLPPGAGMKMLLPESPSSVLFDSTSDAIATIDLKTVDLTTSQMNRRVLLLQKQLLAPLWIESE